MDLKQGDESAFEPIYRRYVDQAVRVAYLVTRNQQAAEDATQEAFIQVLRKVHTLRDPATFRSWFYSILLNAARRTSRNGKGWLFLPIDLLTRRVDVDAATPADAIERSADAEAVRHCLNQLPESHRVPVILRYHAELTEPEIAQAMGLPVGTVKSRLHHARQRLQAMLTDPISERGEVHVAR